MIGRANIGFWGAVVALGVALGAAGAAQAQTSSDVRCTPSDERALWALAEQGGACANYDMFLRACPNGVYAPLAQNQRQRLACAAQAPVEAPVEVPAAAGASGAAADLAALSGVWSGPFSFSTGGTKMVQTFTLIAPEAAPGATRLTGQLEVRVVWRGREIIGMQTAVITAQDEEIRIDGANARLVKGPADISVSTDKLRCRAIPNALDCALTSSAGDAARGVMRRIR